MDNNTFFKWVWRINGVAIACTAIFLLAVLAFDIIGSLLPTSHDDEDIINVADDPDGKERWVLGSAVKTSNYIVIPLVSENDEVEKGRYGSFAAYSAEYYSGTSKNILFIDTRTNTSHWLFPSNNQIIQHFNEFPLYFEGTGQAPEKSVFLYNINVLDTNNDSLINQDDRVSLGISDNQGTNFRILIDEFDRLISTSSGGSEHMFIIYQLAGIGYSLKLDLSSLDVVSVTEIPKVSE